ncbi:carbohydrate-binding protein [Paractinoplanes lichenicola]|uniref:Glycosyl hydrolase n=1 Tax=Paractinoplanes lichenicola TaxID=2802976 RepID=A0ABS1VE08_9ACTN|nr:carbohydrate-binding protein [Actinoplanes lichenicola]MBL7252923.1 glycosyl hydrolase [Actinoplanes lichenicola]
MGRTRKIVLGATVASVTVALGVAATSSSSAAAACGALFDDFNYSSRTDPALTQRGWSIRTASGGPGVPGAGWRADNVTFPTVDGQKVAQLTATTNGTAAGTSHAEFSQSQRRFLAGTYLARVKFADAPVSGPDGDHVNQTFYTISPLAAPMDPAYSELDFSEYLPNGGWGEAGPINYQTSWYTYVPEPWYADNQHSQQARSIAGWHDVQATVGDGHVKYYIDGVLVGDHSGKVYPRQAMSIDFNQWFIDLAGRAAGATAVWQQSVDYVFHAKNQILTPAQATAAISSYRAAGTTHTDTIAIAGDCTVTTPPATTPPTTRPATPPTTTPPTTQPTTPAPSGTAWAPGVAYARGQVVTYQGKRYECRIAHTSLVTWEPPNVAALWLPL